MRLAAISLTIQPHGWLEASCFRIQAGGGILQWEMRLLRCVSLQRERPDLGRLAASENGVSLPRVMSIASANRVASSPFASPLCPEVRYSSGLVCLVWLLEYLQ